MGNSWPPSQCSGLPPLFCCTTNLENQQPMPVVRRPGGKWKPKYRTSITSLPVELLLDFGFNAFEREPEEMTSLYLQMIQYLGVQADNALESSTIRAFASEVGNRYSPVPYHNFHHGWSVTQFLFALFFKGSTLYDLLTKNDILALFTAMLVHDVDHPGNNNAFEVATKSSIALRYNDLSVLENHHAAVGLQIMQCQQRNMFGTLSAQMSEEARESYLHGILQTDMKQHFSMVDTLKEVAKSRSPVFYSQDIRAHRLEMIGNLTHAVDIGNPLLPNFEMSRTWAVRISQEFWNQYEREIENGLPPTQMWADINSKKGFYKAQLGFINFIVSPLWTTLLDTLPQVDAACMLRIYLKDNLDEWGRLLQEEECRQNDEIIRHDDG